MAVAQRLLLSSQGGSVAGRAPAVHWVCGGVFVLAGIVKFTAHSSEVASFDAYGLPSPDAFVYLIGAVEIVGGVLLLAGLATSLVALVLAATMLGAILVSGIGAGEVVPSLTLAPILLAAMVLLFWAGAGPRSLDERLFRNRPAPR